MEDECESKRSLERAYLLPSIEVLKEGLDSLRIQKHYEFAKIFEGEKNAMELSFKRKEDELRQQLKLELQRKWFVLKNNGPVLKFNKTKREFFNEFIYTCSGI